MAQEIKMSAAGLKAMQEELEYLKTVRRKDTIVVGVCSFPNSFNKCSMVYCKLIVFCKNGSNTVIFQMLQGSFLEIGRASCRERV